MELGYSILLREYVAATEVDYGDCAEFQITCPSCHEAIFKAGSFDSERQYFSHYAASRSDVRECELRVGKIGHLQAAEENVLGRGQTMAAFFSRFQESLVEWFFWDDLESPVTDAEQIKDVLKQIRWAVARPSFIWFAKYLRPEHEIETDFYDCIAKHVFSELAAERSPFWIARQSAFAKDFLTHLSAPNSLNAWCFVVGVVALLCTRDDLQDVLLYQKDKKLKRFFGSIADNMSARSLLVGIFINTIYLLLVCVPYLNFIKGDVRESSSRKILLRHIPPNLDMKELMAHMPIRGDMREGLSDFIAKWNLTERFANSGS